MTRIQYEYTYILLSIIEKENLIVDFKEHEDKFGIILIIYDFPQH